MMETLPDHEITEWLQWAWSMNEGDSNIRCGSELGYKIMQYHLTEFDMEDEESYLSYWTDEEELW